ncbi:hypothetical protein PVK06_039178 [Gossypium arboreum]|uniref:Reverse transcriptase n=1 Tax=Gossypium arboreum TaxID=29729 RepID=A0ABR0N2U0_GOSAR|nr:hypothetical protein PVK06_039178 [Gossypium arboreum]
MMERIGFDRSWVDIIVKCIIFVSYLVIVNGKAEELFRPTRGFRQRDSLSLFLLLICSEGLSTLMRLVLRDGLIKGVKASRMSPQISHMLFADDCIVFEEANDRGAQILKVILREYEGVDYLGFQKEFSNPKASVLLCDMVADFNSSHSPSATAATAASLLDVESTGFDSWAWRK